MQYKNVCPKCGQIYESEWTRCPLCGTPAPEPAQAAAPRRRITDQERRERRAAMARQEREAHRAEQPQRQSETRRAEQPQRQREATPSSFTGRPSVKDEQEQYLQTLEQQERAQRDATKARIPRGCLVFSAILLIVALLISGSFLLWKVGVLNLGLYSSLAPKAQPETTAAPALTDCESIQLNPASLVFDTAGATGQITATALPASSVGTFSFSTGDAAVATVNANGLVTAVGNGETEITVIMGKASAVCAVTCSFTEPQTVTEAPTSAGILTSGDEPELNNTDMTFFGEDEFFVLKVTNASEDAEITWSSDNEAIATVDENGKVVAVADGKTIVTATIGDMTAECIVRCNFD